MHPRLPSERALVPGEDRSSEEAAKEAAGAGLRHCAAHRADTCHRRCVDRFMWAQNEVELLCLLKE